MKKIYTGLFLFSGLLLSSILGGCTHDGSLGDSSICSPLSISSVSSSGVETRSTTALTSGTLGVFRLQDTRFSLDTLSNVPYAGSAGGWTAVRREVLMAGTTKVRAYYPYNSSNTDGTKLSMTSWIGSQANTLSHDLLYSLPTTATSVTTGQSAVSFTLKRAFALLRFTLSGSSTLSGTGVVNSISVYNKNLPKSNTFNMENETYGTNVLASDNRLNSEDLGSPNLSDNPVIDLLLPPCTLYDWSNTTLDVTITVDGVQRLVKLDLAANNISGSLTAGRVYPINISLIQNAQPESNCYIVAPGSSIFIPVSRATTGNADNFPSGASFTTGLLWSDVSASHVTATAVGRYIKVVAGATPGNSVVYAKNGNDDIVWSWHIWVTGYNPGIVANTNANKTTYSYNSNLWMDRNLGATTNTVATVGTLGLIYQWGRKDPFPGSTSVSATTEPTLFGEKTSVTVTPVAASLNLVNSIQNPLTYYSGVNNIYDWYSNTIIQNNALWYDGTATKTIYDPCPVGWRVPYFTDTTTSCWNGLTTGTWNSGYSWTGTPNIGYYPASGYRECTDGTLKNVGSEGRYWSAIGSIAAIQLRFENGLLWSGIGYVRSYGSSVRCVKN